MPINSFFHLYDTGGGAARKVFFNKIYHVREKQPTVGLEGWKHAILQEFHFESPLGM